MSAKPGLAGRKRGGHVIKNNPVEEIR
jgi:hypothetical protein